MAKMASCKFQFTIGFIILNYINGLPHENSSDDLTDLLSSHQVEFVKPNQNDGKNDDVGVQVLGHAILDSELK